MQLIIDNNFIINKPIDTIIYALQREANWEVFPKIVEKDDYLSVTCPFHKEGKESHPSCSIYTGTDSDEIIPGTYHCFTCGEKGQLYQLVAFVLNLTDEEAKKWLVERFGDEYDGEGINFPEWDEPNKKSKKEPTYLDETILYKYAYYHPYLQQRKIDFETAKKFNIGWNESKDTITFPVWDESNRLVMITERSISKKNFYIPAGVEKPVYLLNTVLNEGWKYVVICESQFNALTCWTYGIPAVALFGTGTDYQYEILRNTNIRSYILCFDGDEAGFKGAIRFKKAMPSDVFVDVVKMPIGKDVNDLNKEEFFNILKNNGILLDNYQK